MLARYVCYPMRIVGRSLVLLLLLACNSGSQPHPAVAPLPVPPETVALDTAGVYSTAIAEYIKVMRNSGASFPDTVYIGRHAEFPEIELPTRIEQTSVRIISSTDADVLKAGAHFAYLNIFGWFAAGQAELYVVCFTQGMRHRPDGRDDRHLRFTIGSGPEELVLDSLWQ